MRLNSCTIQLQADRFGELMRLYEKKKMSIFLFYAILPYMPVLAALSRLADAQTLVARALSDLRLGRRRRYFPTYGEVKRYIAKNYPSPFSLGLHPHAYSLADIEHDRQLELDNWEPFGGISP